MTGFDSKRQAAQDKLTDEADTLTIVYQRGFADGKRSAERKPLTEDLYNKLLEDLYNELLFAVGRKYPDETRHQTALRYIRQAEMFSAEPALPEPSWAWWKIRLSDAWAVWQGKAIAVRQTTKADLGTKEQP